MKKNKFLILKFNQGVSLYFALVIMTILLSIGLMVSTILSGQIKMIREIDYSLIAFYAGDSGIEKALYKLYKKNENPPCLLTCKGSVGEAEYSVTGYSVGGIECPPAENDYFCIKSVGIYKGIRRSIEVSR